MIARTALRSALRQHQATASSSRLFSSSAASWKNVAVLGASGGIGQPVSICDEGDRIVVGDRGRIRNECGGRKKWGHEWSFKKRTRSTTWAAVTIRSIGSKLACKSRALDVVTDDIAGSYLAMLSACFVINTARITCALSQDVRANRCYVTPPLSTTALPPAQERPSRHQPPPLRCPIGPRCCC